MAEPFIFINTYAIKPGQSDAYKDAFQQVAEIVHSDEPKMLYFACHISEDGSEATTVQVHADADNMAFHMDLVGDQIRSAAEFLDFSTMSVQIYGSPTDQILNQMRQLAGDGTKVTVRPATVAFDRFTEP